MVLIILKQINKFINLYLYGTVYIQYPIYCVNCMFYCFDVSMNIYVYMKMKIKSQVFLNLFRICFCCFKAKLVITR